MIENIFDAEKFEWQGDQKNVVGRITSLNHIESVPQIDPQCIQELKSESASIFSHIAPWGSCLYWHGMAVNAYAVDNLIPGGTAFALRTQNCHVITIFAERSGLSPNPRVYRHCLIFDNYEYSSLPR
jgi:hypothetical protein